MGEVMARLSDVIEDFIKQMFIDNEENVIFIQRNELADHFGCAPSQINYVLTTRFTYEKGYLIESKRGGGGHIVIKQIDHDSSSKREELISESIGNTITYHNASALLDHLQESEIINPRECEIMKMAVNDRSLVSSNDKNKVRADILKGMIMIILS